MAEGILRAAGGDILDVHSAGSKPAGYVHPLAVKALAEIGIDISKNKSKSLEKFLKEKIETVITVCGKADGVCPIFPGQVNRFHWPFYDPGHAKGTEAQKLKEFRRIRDKIKLKFDAYAEERRNELKAAKIAR